MRVATVSTADYSLLKAVRSTLVEADEALLCVAFVSDAGVNLLKKELTSLGANARLLATTVFGTTTATALNTAAKLKVQVKVLNPRATSTYHPKAYIARRAQEAAAVVGSANMTGGLVNNVELATLLQGRVGEDALHDAWAWSEELWHNEQSEIWVPKAEPGPVGVEQFHDDLYQLVGAEVAREPVFRVPDPGHVAQGRPRGGADAHRDVHRHRANIATERTAHMGNGAEPVPAWMFNLAWDYLRRHGRLSYSILLNELHVFRSDAVLAVLGRLPSVRVVSRRPVEVGWRE